MVKEWLNLTTSVNQLQGAEKLFELRKILRMKFRDSQPGRSVSGDQNSGQWPIFRPYVAASNKTGMSEKPLATL